MNRLSTDAKQAIVQKALLRKGQNLRDIAQAHSIGYSTLNKWLIEYRKNGKIGRAVSSTHQELSAAEKLQHLVATAALDEAALGAYCREQGIYSFQLKEWKETLMTQKLTEKKQTESAELRALRAENKALKKELRRKDKALAETSALLVLKKKASLIWGEPEDD